MRHRVTGNQLPVSVETTEGYFIQPRSSLESRAMNCRVCGGALRLIACIDDPVVIEKILSHLDKKPSFHDTNRLPETRAPPQAVLFGRSQAPTRPTRAAATIIALVG